MFWKSDGLSCTRDVKLVNEAPEEWDMCESKVAETPSVTDEPNVQNCLNSDYMSKAFAAKYRRTAAKLSYFFALQFHGCICDASGFNVLEPPRQREGLAASSLGDPPAEESLYIDRTLGLVFLDSQMDNK